MKKSIYLIIIMVIIILVLFVFSFFKSPKYRINRCLEAYACVRKENNLYNCKYCSEFGDNNICKIEKYIECEINDNE